MKSRYKTIVLQFLAAIVCILTFAQFAHAVTGTPLDCPGVIAAPGGYRLTQDSTCAGFGWNESNKIFSLNGFTLTLGNFAFAGNRLTMRNGTVRLNGDFRAFGVAGTLSHLSLIKGNGPLGSQFGLEAGTGFIVDHCTFSNFSSNALTFYFGAGGGKVTNSVFIGNKTGISIQLTSRVLIENNRFISNGRGVNLFDEDGAGVNNNTIRHNTFQNNGVGINMFAHAAGFPPQTPSLQGNRFTDNRIEHSNRSGMYIELTCRRFVSPTSIVCAGQNTLVRGNQFNHNGFDSGSGEPDDDDGLVAQAFLRSPPDDVEAYPPGLAGVTLANNRADQNADLGFDVIGVTDGRRNRAKSNGNPAQCDGVVCRTRNSASGAIALKAAPLPTVPQPISQEAIPSVLESIALETVPEAPLPSD